MKQYYFQAECCTDEEKFITKRHLVSLDKEPDLTTNQIKYLKIGVFYLEESNEKAEDVLKILSIHYNFGEKEQKFQQTKISTKIYLTKYEDGEKIGIWTLRDCFPAYVDLGYLHYSSRDDVEINIKWGYLHAEFTPQI